MTIKVQKDLGNITTRRARKYVEEFHKQYKGLLDAILDVSANYNDEGLVDINYIINNKIKTITIRTTKVYAEENAKRKQKKLSSNNN